MSGKTDWTLVGSALLRAEQANADLIAGIPEHLAEKEAAFDRFIKALRQIADDPYANPRSRSIARRALRRPSPFDEEPT